MLLANKHGYTLEGSYKDCSSVLQTYTFEIRSNDMQDSLWLYHIIVLPTQIIKVFSHRYGVEETVEETYKARRWTYISDVKSTLEDTFMKFVNSDTDLNFFD